jgi:hypothetical protein
MINFTNRFQTFSIYSSVFILHFYFFSIYLESKTTTTTLLPPPPPPPKHKNEQLEQTINQMKDLWPLSLNYSHLTDDDMEIVAYYVLLQNNEVSNIVYCFVIVKEKMRVII